MGNFVVDPDGYTIVYTDGACYLNGQPGAKAGIGVWFYEGCPYNVSKPVTGRATNNNAEIQAITAAAEQSLKAGIQFLRIITDSQFAINCATNWIRTWKRNGWKTQDREPVINKQELILMEKALDRLENVKFEHVNSHQGIYGNVDADRLARKGWELYQG